MTVEVTERQKILHNEEMYDLVRKSDCKGPYGRPSDRWHDNIKINIYEARWEGMDWIDLAQDREIWRAVVNAVCLHKMWVFC
jgi:hypothetical protein